MKLDPSRPPHGTIRDWVDARAAKNGTAFIFCGGDPDLDWATLRDTARQIATDLTRRGVAPGESVAIMMPNSRKAIEALFGVLYGGFRAAMINLVAGNDAISYALDHSDARFAFVGEDQRFLFEETAKSGTIKALDVEGTGAHEATRLHQVSPDSPALLMYTSGTTGRPKGVVHTQSSLLAGGWTTAVTHNLTPEDRGMCVLPIYHINGLCVTVMSTLISNGSLAMVEKFSVSRFWNQLAETGSTWFSAVPTIISHLLHSETNPDSETKARLRFGRSASSALAQDIHRAFEARFGFPLIETMGLTETAAQILANPLPPGIRKIGSPGVAFGNEATVLGSDLKPVPVGVEGELAVRGPNVMHEYLKNDAATRETFTPDGWLRTGDLARQDEEGYFFITGRLKELIIKGGENIAPREIDEVLYSHPDVVEAAAFARPCPSYGERVEAAVKLAEGSSLDEDYLKKICIARLGNFKSPDRIFFLDELPKGPSGKVQRMRLAQLNLS